jgi:hypothetical protein
MKTPWDDDGPFWFPEPEALLITRLLIGVTPDVPYDDDSRVHYLTPDEECESRKALAALLRTRKRPGWPGRDTSITRRESLFNEACHLLADLIEIDPGDESKRRIVFTNPKGQPPQYGPRYKIFRDVEMLLKAGLSPTKAVKQVAEEYGVSNRWVENICTLFRTEQ